MYNINDYIIYKREVCKILEVLKSYINNQDYYLLAPLSDESLKIKVPTTSKEIRKIINLKTVNNIIEEIPKISPIDIDNKNLEIKYKELLSSGTHEDLIKIIKTTYLRNKTRQDNNKKTTDKDNYYFNLAEKYLYQEFQIVLGLDYNSTKNYVIEKVSNNI